MLHLTKYSSNIILYVLATLSCYATSSVQKRGRQEAFVTIYPAVNVHFGIKFLIWTKISSRPNMNSHTDPPLGKCSRLANRCEMSNEMTVRQLFEPLSRIYVDVSSSILTQQMISALFPLRICRLATGDMHDSSRRVSVGSCIQLLRTRYSPSSLTQPLSRIRDEDWRCRQRWLNNSMQPIPPSEGTADVKRIHLCLNYQLRLFNWI